MNHAKKIVYVFVVLILFFAIIFEAYLATFLSKYNGYILAESNKYGVDYVLALSIAKAESKFNSNAKSAANAIGIMQIKLETANYMQDIYEEEALVEQDLFNPEINIRCGIRYIKYLLAKFEDENVAICAYNAGETIVRMWLSNSIYSADEKTLFEIPYEETRNYLKTVNFYKKIYKNVKKACSFF